MARNSSDTDTLVALHRFGLGARPGDPARVASDPRGFVLDMLTRPQDAMLTGSAGLETSDKIFRDLRNIEIQRKNERDRPAVVQGRAAPLADGTAPLANATPGPSAMDRATAPDGDAAGSMGRNDVGSAPAMSPPSGKPKPAEPPFEQQVFRAELGARYRQMATSENGLVERLVAFWSNHFAVSVAKGSNLRVLAGPYEREAIRPFVLGRFADMLKAVETHPAMLFYLDNNQSIGPTSRNGRSSKRGLNENLAREILELHTLGVGGGYGQGDVTSFARIITGWGVAPPEEDPLSGGRFTFWQGRHEPGDHAVLSKVYAVTGVNQGLSVLEDLARHPATARHLARKLASHFVADEPPPGLIERLAQTFADTDGDLGRVTRALVEAAEAWDAPLAKLRTPQDFVVAGLRATGKAPEPGAIVSALSALGQPLWQPPGPNGWGDTEAAWASPEGMTARLDFATQWARQNGALNPKDLLESILGSSASPETRQAVARAESRQQGLALLFMSPEFQRR